MSSDGGVRRFFEDVSVGEELAPLHKQINLPRMMAYGAATWDFIRVHYDADHVRELGFPGPFVDGQMLGAFLAQHVQDWAGPGAFLRKLGFRNRVMAYPGDSLVCRGVVTGLYREGDGNDGPGLAECDLWIENQRAERVVEPASALVQLPLRPCSGSPQ
jgi:acyl dehydratase